MSLIVPTPAGDFRDRVAIVRRNVNNLNEGGEQVPVDETVASVPAKVTPLKSEELAANAEDTLSITHEVRLRYTPLVDHTTVLIFRGRRLEVSDVTDVGEQRRELAITCRERKS